MKPFVLILLVILFSSRLAIAQDFTPYPGTTTHCPDEENTYTSSSFCTTPTWTITNGKIRKVVNGTTEWVTTHTASNVIIKWDNVAEVGKLKATATCGKVTNVTEKNFSIRSLTGVTPANIRTNVTNLYCGVSSVWVLVDAVNLPSTGGTTGVTEQRADRYEWTLPAGWQYNGSTPTGPVITVEESITITPVDGCKGGNISVKAYVSCTSGKKYSSSTSRSLNREITTSIVVPRGYTGPKCGNKKSVTFSASYLICATNYKWTATNTQWKDANGALGPWNTYTNK